LEHKQRCSLGQRLVLAAQLALELAHATRLDGPHVLVRRWLQRAQHRLAPRGEVRLVQPLSSEEHAELRVAQTSGLHHHAKLVFGLALLGSGRRALVQRGLLRHGVDRTGGEQPSRKRGLRHPDLPRQRGRRDRVRSGHALDHLPLEVL
jgi:hypothetical protein